MSNNAAPAVDAEMQQFQDNLLQSIREFKEGDFAKITKINTEVANEKILNESVNNYSVRL